MKSEKKLLKNNFVSKYIIMVIGMILIITGTLITIFCDENLLILGTIIIFIGLFLMAIEKYMERNEEFNKKCYKIDIRLIIKDILYAIAIFLIGFGLVRVVSFEKVNVDVLGLTSSYTGILLVPIINLGYQYLKENDKLNIVLEIGKNDKEHKYSIRNVWLLFIIYGFLGWCVEFLVFAILYGEFIKRGFMHITFLSIWAIGGVLITLIFRKNQRFVFLKSFLYLSFLEYISSILLEILFNTKWWNYSNEPFNINGRVCLANSIAFGIGGFIIVKFLSPFINSKLNKCNKKVLNTIVIITLIIYCTDGIISLYSPNMGSWITG